MAAGQRRSAPEKRVGNDKAGHANVVWIREYGMFKALNLNPRSRVDVNLGLKIVNLDLPLTSATIR